MNEEIEKAKESLNKLGQNLDASSYYSNQEHFINISIALNRAKESEKELNELREFAKVLCKMKIVDEHNITLIKKVVEKYGKQN